MTSPAGQELIDRAAKRLSDLLAPHRELVVGLHLIGSATDGDFHSGQSDLDFVAVLSRTASETELDGLAALHLDYATDHSLPMLGGVWLTEAELKAGPDAAVAGPTSLDNNFIRADLAHRNPVTWMSLPAGDAVFGQLNQTPLWQSRKRLMSWVVENAAGYWTGWHRDASSLWTPRGLRMLGRAEPMWGVLGISRLAYTDATGEITSKTGAGGWALETFGDDAIVREALAYRAGKPAVIADLWKRKAEALRFVARMIGGIVD
ncbi:MAG: aminoglycoside adenylyltransferase domain-containing protein [Devosia sp.]